MRKRRAKLLKNFAVQDNMNTVPTIESTELVVSEPKNKAVPIMGITESTLKFIINDQSFQVESSYFDTSNLKTGNELGADPHSGIGGLLTTKQLQERLNIGRTTLWMYGKMGLPSITHQGKKYYNIAEVLEYLRTVSHHHRAINAPSIG